MKPAVFLALRLELDPDLADLAGDTPDAGDDALALAVVQLLRNTRPPSFDLRGFGDEASDGRDL